MNNTLTTRYGSWALVTGASQGIGRAFAISLAKQGLNVFLVARNPAALQTLCQEIENRYGVQATFLAQDISNPDSHAALLSGTQNLDIGLYVLSAGFGSAGDFFKLPIENELNMVELNCRRILEQCYDFGQRLATRQRGGLILFSSLLAFQGTPFSSNYAATKAYVQSLGEGLAIELKAHNIDVLNVAPGPTNTGFASRANMSMSMTLTPEVVAEQALAALKKRHTIRPGWLSKLLGWSLAMAPRWVAVRIIGHIMKGMAPKH